MKYIALVCLYSFFPLALSAQDFGELRFQHLNTHLHLSNPNLTTLFSDSYGLLWIGSENGLTLFDGINASVFKNNPNDTNSICANYITQIIEDKDGNLWIGTQNGLSRYNRRKGNFSNFKKFESNAPIAPNFYAYPFYIDDQEYLWSYFSGTIFYIRMSQLRAYSVSNNANGRIYVDTPFYQPLPRMVSNSENGICYYSLLHGKVEKTVKRFMDPEKNELVIRTNDALWIDDNRTFICSDKGLIIYDWKQDTFQIYHQYQELSHIQCNAIAHSPFHQNIYYVGTENQGILIFDLDKGKFTQQYTYSILNPNSLSGNSVERITIDKKGNLFAIIRGIGMDYANIKERAFIHAFTKEEKPSGTWDNNVQALFPAGNQYLIANDKNGIFVLHSSGKIQDHFLEGNQVRLLTGIDSTQVLATTIQNDFFLLSKTGNRWSPIKLSGRDIPNPDIMVIEDIKVINHQILMATSRGLYTLNIAGNKISIQEDEFVNNKAEWHYFKIIIPVNSTDFLLQSFYTNLYLIKGDRDKNIEEIGRTPFNINDYVAENDYINLATSDGLWRYSLNQKKLKPDALITDFCNGIITAPNNTLWLSTSNGLIRYDRSTGNIQRFTEEDGLQHFIFNPGAMAIDDERNIICGGVNGINIFNPDRIRENKRDYSGIITQLKINEKIYTAANPMVLPSLDLQYHQNNLEFMISPLYYVNANEQSLSYRLRGYENHLTQIKGLQHIRYQKLPPGDYIFELTGSDQTKLRNMHIRIYPALWQTLWFKTGIFLLAAAIITFIVRSRFIAAKENQKKRVKLMLESQEEERKRIARELHDDFGARLSTLKLYIGAIQKKPDQTKEISRQVTDIVDATIGELRNILTNLSPKVLDENGLKAALKELALKLNQSGLISCNTDTYFRHQLNATEEFSLYRISQELINNTLKYAEADEINISIVEREKELVYLYEDNGKGFEYEKVKKGYGLNNIQLHTVAMNATCYIDSAAGKGTAVTIIIPKH